MSKDAPEFFPPSGSFRSVVPLSEIADTPGEAKVIPPAPTLPSPPPPPSRRVAETAHARRAEVGEGGVRPPENEDEETLVPTRSGLSTARRHEIGRASCRDRVWASAHSCPDA